MTFSRDWCLLDLKMYPQEYLNFRPPAPEETTQRVHQLKEQLATNTGAPILVITREWDRPGEPEAYWITGCFSGKLVITHRLMERRFLGIAEDPYLTRDGTLLDIHSPQWVYYEGRYADRKLKATQGPFARLVFPLRPSTLGTDLEGSIYDFQGKPIRRPGPVLEVLIGNENISGYYEDRALDRMRDTYGEDAIPRLKKTKSELYDRNLDQVVLREFQEMKKALFDQQRPLIVYNN